MKDISIYFQPISSATSTEEGSIGTHIIKHTKGDFPNLTKKGIAIIDVPEYRNHTKFEKQPEFSNQFREKLYPLYKGVKWGHSIYDLGTIFPGEKSSDTYYAIKTTCHELLKKGIIPILIGGSQDLTRPMFEAFSEEQLVNITAIDNQLNLGNPELIINEANWLSHILFQQPSTLFNFSNIATQVHYNKPQTIQLFEDLYFDNYSLGAVNSQIEQVEPYLRNTDLLSIDIESIRASELQNTNYTSPNGLFAHQICRIGRYAGISDKLSAVGIFNYYSQENTVTDELIAQIIWYFNEGYAARKGDFPIGSKKNYKKFRVFLEELKEEIIFYKSIKSSRWWIEVAYPAAQKSKYLRHQMVPCSYETYQKTMKGEVPDLWWKTYQKLI